MLKFYFTTVLIWSIIIYASYQIAASRIVSNGWVETPNDSVHVSYLYSLFTAMVPIIRAIVAVGTWYMFAVKKKEGEAHGDF